ncbi:MAG TPA: DUF2946 family protein [Xanthobacteraceae bacterium]|jgi:hypothetical protein|nr:DUF2946 family protein [Xanthobacteraceae bacterium]
MHRRSHQPPAWRLFGAALGAFAIAVQLLLTAWMIGQAAAGAGGTPDLAVICTHDQQAPVGDDGGAPVAPKSHGACPACACPFSAKVLAPPPALVFVAAPQPASQAMRPASVPRPTSLDFRAPYASRAPPRSV